MLVVYKVPAAYPGGIDDVLLAGFAIGVSQWRRRRYPSSGTAVLLDLEGDGREGIMAGADLSRTVGRLATAHPVRLDPGPLSWSQVCSDGPTLGRAVKQIKEQLRATPDNGIGFGVLRYLNPQTRAELAGFGAPQIGFTHNDPDVHPRHVLEVSVATIEEPAGPQLLATWSWVSGALDEGDVRELAEMWFTVLQSLVTFAGDQDSGGHTPSDFSLAALTQVDIDDLDRLFDSDDGGDK
jgi:hypothetical protein